MIYLLPILAVAGGFLLALLMRPQDRKQLKLFLAFSGAFLLSITVFHLLPHLYEHGSARTAGIFIMLGILLQIFLEFFSKGAEHGHLHLHRESTTFPLMLFLSLSIHSLLEGMAIHQHHSVVYGILIHKMPVALILSHFFLNASLKKVYSLLFMIFFALMTPLGTWMAGKIQLEEGTFNLIQALVVGIFLHISTVILFESSEGHKFNISKLLVIALGMVSAYFI